MIQFQIMLKSVSANVGSTKRVDYLKKYGNATHAPGGAIKFTLTRRKANKIISDLKIVGDARGILTFVFTFSTKSSCHAKLA